MNSCRRAFANSLGADCQLGSLAATTADGETIEYFVSRVKPPNYLRYAHNPCVPANDPCSIINQYTSHENGHYIKVNLALASDSPDLHKYGAYIAELRASILASPLLDHSGPLYRGVDLSADERRVMEEHKRFFVPSFTSTTPNRSLVYKKRYYAVFVLFLKIAFFVWFEVACSFVPVPPPHTVA